MSCGSDVLCGYLDVKISARSRRGLTPWKAWQKQWCEIKRLDSIQNGVELKLKSSAEGSVLNCMVLPRSATICRTESRTKQHSFGVFNMGRNQKPILFLSGSSESDSQEWMAAIRRMLSIASSLPVGNSNFRVSLVDNVHSRAAGLVGLHGVLGMNSQEITISDPYNGQPKITWKWYQFHQFHLQAPTQPVDDKLVVVMHTSGDFPAGPGQLYLYCKQGPRLLNNLVARGKRLKNNPGLISTKRLSRSEGDLCSNSQLCIPDSPMCFRSQTGSDDSGVRVSIASDDSGYALKSKTASSLISIGLALLTKTPGGSESNDDSVQDLTNLDEHVAGSKGSLPRRESGVSLASGIYEEIPDDHVGKQVKRLEHASHIYENPLELILDGTRFAPPPLPPRRNEATPDSEDEVDRQLALPNTSRDNSKEQFKQRCNTLPAKDLSRMSQIFTTESEYVVMSPSKLADRNCKASIAESLYMPMSPVIHLKNKIVESVESCYMSMNGRKT